MKSNFVKYPIGYKGKMIKLEENITFPLRKPDEHEPLNIPRIMSYLLYGDDKHIERKTTGNNRGEDLSIHRF